MRRAAAASDRPGRTGGPSSRPGGRTTPVHHLVWLVAVAVAGAGLFATMALSVRHGNPAWDRSVFGWFHRTDQNGYSDAAGRLVRQITRLGETPATALVTLLLAGWLATARRWHAVVFVVVVPGVGAVLANASKVVFAHPRPDVRYHYTPLHSYSFPSGHTATATVTWLTAALVLLRYLTTRVRYVLAAVCATVPLLVATSRVYLGVHWPTDVIAGLGFGVTWVLGWDGLSRLRLGRGRRGRHADQQGR